MADLFVTLASIAPAASKVGGRDAERIPGISPSMKDGVLAERSTAPTPSKAGFTLDSDVVALWRFDEAAGTTAADLSANALTLTAGTTNPSIAAGNISNARFYDGYNTWMGRSLAGSTEAALCTRDLTIEGWIYLDPLWATSNGLYHSQLVGLYDTVGSGIQFGISIVKVDPGTTPPSTIQGLYFYWHNSSFTGEGAVDPGVVIPTGVWTHFAWRRRYLAPPPSQNFSLDYFQNGAWVKNWLDTGDVGINVGNPHLLRVGAVPYLTPPAYNYWRGGIDEIRISKCARSDQEILNGYRRGV